MGSAISAAMFRRLMFLVKLDVYALRAIFRTREELLIENLALRQQVATLKKERPRPVLGDASLSISGDIKLDRLTAVR